MYDVIIIGAGPSGMMCAIAASENHKRVLLLEKNEDVGKKMKITGGSRCNITNLKNNNEFIQALPVINGRFLHSALNQFSPYDIYDYFTDLGVPLKVEKDDKVFPQSNQAQDLITTLKEQLAKNNVDIKCNTEVKNIKINNDSKLVETTNGDFITSNIVIATGGKSYPHTGSTGFGYDQALKMQHTLADLFPTESPIISNDPIIHSKVLQGLSFTNVTLSLLDDHQKIIKQHTDDLIITHFGLSGPAALKLSQFIYHYLQKHREATLKLDLIPTISFDQLIYYLKDQRLHSTQKNVITILKNILPNRLLDYLFKKLHLNEQLKLADLSNKQLITIASAIKNFMIKVHEIKPIEKAFVTGGGVSLKEVNPKTMESLIIPGIYFIGEVLDLHGYTGGYNITIALSTGYSAGKNIY